MASIIDTKESKYIKACRGDNMKVPPVWLMRQAGRYLPEYRAVRQKHEFLEICNNPELACEVTLQPIRRFGFDAAILFSDILIPLVPMGANLTFGNGEGPRINPPFRSLAEIEKLRSVDPREDLGFVLESIRMIRRELPAEVALIGFCGAPFTLATYMVEGGKPNPFANIKALMYKDPRAFALLGDKLKNMVRIYLREMVDSGADAIQLFDTWAGTLHSSDFKTNVLPFVKEIFGDLRDLNVPMTYFVHNGSHLLRDIKETGCNVVSLDWRCSLSNARKIFGKEMALQGNLDPTVLLGDEKTIRKKVRGILDEAVGNGGFIFNLGHGILPMTPISSVEIMLDEIRGAK
ncbi:MAG: uroporphyrinogen decarboxylase [Candidatus Zixiibacteriota bacterium]|nr:MAG: uroporphyrinogen decarboxylase [candidate division Zixibacteria bacterium]